MSAIQFKPKSTIIRQAVERHKPWIEAQLGASLGECLQLRFDINLSAIAAAHLVPEAKFNAPPSGERGLRKLVQRVCFPADTPPAISLSLVADHSTALTAGARAWKLMWLDCPIAMQIEGLPGTIVVMNVPLIAGVQEGGEWREVVMVRRDCASQLLALVQEKVSGDAEPGLHIYGASFRKTRSTQWEDLILDANVARLLRQDFECFFCREAWFKANRLPFRRGYLLHGPPGNGKTSAICAMLSRPGVTGHTLNMSVEHLDDNDLSGVFDEAAKTAPAILVFEDLDRYFNHAHKEKQESKITLQHLLNCLDGATTQDGIIVVATANNPQGLDPAILRRPGRFDRVVGFPHPDVALRSAYFQRLISDLMPGELADCAEASCDFSFAQLKESYVLAGQYAFEEERPIMVGDIVAAASALRDSMRGVDGKGERMSGFRCGQ